MILTFHSHDVTPNLNKLIRFLYVFLHHSTPSDWCSFYFSSSSSPHHYIQRSALRYAKGRVTSVRFVTLATSSSPLMVEWWCVKAAPLCSTTSASPPGVPSAQGVSGRRQDAGRKQEGDSVGDSRR